MAAERLAQAGGDTRALEALERRALAALQRPVKLGFSPRIDVQQLPDLVRLRPRAEFRLAELDIDFPANPFASGK